MRPLSIALLVVLATAGTASAEKASESDATVDNPEGWVALPGVRYSPEDGLSLSASAIHYWGQSGNTVQPTRLKFFASLSLRGSGEIHIDPDVWFLDGRWNLSLVSSLSELKRKYYGIGYDTEDDAVETFTARRLYARMEVARRLPHNLFAAGVYDFRYEDIFEPEIGGDIETGRAPGSDGGRLSGLGVELRYDSRDSTTFPSRGINLESSPRFYTSLLGSDYSMVRWFTHTSAFFLLPHGHVLALDSKIELRFGDVPFDFMSDAGGNRILRGLLEGRYRDNHYVAVQAEYRFPIYWRFRGVAFTALGQVANGLADFRPGRTIPSIGAGLRYALRPKQGIHLRLDAATADGNTGVYLNLLEAF